MTEHTNFILHRILMPTVLGVASLLRPSAISLVYLLLFFILPLTSVPQQSIPGLTKALYVVSITISIMLLTCHVGLQIALLASETIRNLIVHCSLTEVLLRHIGFIRMDDFKNYLLLVGWIAPELIVFIGAIIVFVLLKKSVNTVVEEPLVSQQTASSYAFIEGGVEEVEKPRRQNLLQRSQFGALICLVMLFLTSAIRPSVIGAFYFLIFLLSGTYWATYKTLERGFGMIMRAVLFVLALHICLVTLYQTPAAQIFLNNSTLPARLMALEPLLQSTCDAGGDIRVITINNYFGWDSFVFPIVILVSYYIIAVRSIVLIRSQDVKFRGTQNPEQTELTERTPLMRHTKRKDRRQVSGGTETSPHELQPSDSLEEHKEDDEPHPSFCDNMQDCVASLIGLACEHSYLFTSITMMTWSIIYHSWLTFVFLIWANILWMIPNQRQAMLRSSPLIVLYAECLLIAGYIYSLKLEDHELPRRVDTPGINLEKIGLVNPPDVPVCVLLIVKVAFTSIFWITLRQLCKETKEKKKKPSTIQPSDIVAPRTTTESQDIDSGPIEHYTSKFLKRIGRSAKNILVKSWIWLLILVIFLCAISGKKMTGFRIFYMALFLFFLLAFQISWVGWMKVMFGYWVFLIIYAMFTLVLIYTYQFDKFSEYWDYYLGIPVKLQNDIGLEKFEVKGLFLHLFAPTIIVIMTAIQVHYIHKEFIASLRRSIASRSQPDEINRSDIAIAIDDRERGGTNTVSSEEISPSKKEIWQKRIKNLWLTCRKFLNEAIDFMWIIFEVHLVKVIFIVAFICCVETVSVLHLAFVLFCVIAVTSQEKFQVFFSRLIAVIMAILILAKMIYQIEYIHHENYGVLCHYGNTTTDNSSLDIDTNSSVSSTPSPFMNTTNQSVIDNNAEWFGFIKTGDKSGNLFNMLNGYVIFMIIVTLHEISVFRKAYINTNNDIEYKRPRVIFSGVKRENAEESLKGLIKYLFNYGYYKFGLEVTFVALASCICFHQDLAAILYSIWLCIFVVLDRRKCAKLWPAFLIFTSILIPLQYIVFVGLPPGLCIEYPWRDIKGLDEWAVLPGHRGTHKSWKLLFDFILLMFIARQQKIFNIEAKIRKNNLQYDGGSNESILDEISQLKKNDEPFINPTANFMERVRNWSDILKVCIFNGLYWITLTIVFLVATQTINLFSVGYLVGAFIFLWQGTDFYLRPLQQIIKWWSFLIYYNVAVIAIQTILQIGGCLFFDFLQNNACWVVHLLGIGCASSNVNEEFENLKVCPATHDDEGVAWDTVGFAFLIIQLRIFSSYYFCHVINEAKASALLAERGAELIEDLRQKEIQHREKQEQKILRKIKMKMEKIRATQQRTLGASEKATHYDDDATVPLVRSNSLISCPGSGYHTPIEDEDQNNDEFLSDLPSDNAALTIFSSSIQNQALSPSSAVMTVSLDGYLEPKRFSFGSPPNLDTGRTPSQSDHSPSVFSFPPSNENNTKVKLPSSPVPSKGLNTVNTNQNLNQDNSSALNVTTRHRRQSSGTSVSWNERVKKVEPNYERRYSYKRQSSSGTGYLSNITQSQSRRCSQCAQDDSLSTPEYGLPVEDHGKKLPTTHPAAIRAGDYYMFDDVDEKFELDLLPEEDDYLGATGKISTSEKKLKDRKTFLEVLENKRKSASAPSSQIGFKKEEESKIVQSDPLPILPSLISDKPDQPTDSTDSKSKKPSDKETEDATEEKEDKRSAVIRIFEGILVSLAVKLNRCSRQYRYVMRVLGKEKRALKENPEFIRSNTDGQAWKPFKFLHKIPKSRISDGAPSSSSSHDTPTTSRAVRHSITQFDIRSEPEPHTSTKTINTDNKNIETDQTDQKDLQRSELESEDTSSRRMRRTSTVPEIRVLAPSLETGLDDTTILDTQHLKDNNKIDIRDDDFEDFEDDDFVSKEHYVFVEFLIAVWYAILANTDFVCYFVVFLNQIVSASILSLPLPFMVFMWGTLSLPRPTKTFWVTLIAYTLSVVLIKCIFQFKMIWYDYLSLPNQPLSAATIIGIESKSNYAALDLILLLVLFFHRFVLKSQGLWKSAYRIDHIHDGVYILEEKLPKDTERHNLQRTDDDVKETVVISKDEKALVLSTQDEKAAVDTVDSEQVHVHVSSLIDEPGNYLPGVVKMTSAKYCSSITDFFKDLIHMSRLPCDVYAFMFLCDFTNFFVLLLGFTAFGSQHGDGGVSEYLTENKVPVPFLIMLLIQFFLIIADRAIYLRKSLGHKIIYHYFTIIGIHIWMFFVVPGVTERKFNALAPPIIFYMVKCFYFLLSSYQIRSGYPKRILGNFLCKSFTVVNMTFFKIYMAIPFLYELRTFLDWVCTESTFTVFDWLKMEDIFAEIFNLKCARQMEKDFPVPRAQKKPMLTKIIMGGLAVVAIVVLIWAPLTLFALNNAVGYANVPFRATALLQIGPYEPIYEIRTADSIKPFDMDDMIRLQNAYRKDKTALTFITSYDEVDIAAILLQTNSPELWRISPPSKNLLINDIKENKDIAFHFSYTISRSPPNKQASETLSGETKYIMTNQKEKEELYNMLTGVKNNYLITLTDIFPKFIKIKNSGEMSVITPLTPEGKEYRDIFIKLFSDPNDADKVWWEIREVCTDDHHKNILKHIPHNKMCDKNVTLITFNDKKFPDTFSFLTAGGIIGMYTTFILVAARVLRSSLITGASRNIMFEELPYVDRVLQLCLDIYLVREAQEFALEEDLFAKLIFLYRSPETMIKWTRPKEKEDETDETGSVQSRSSRRTIK